MLTYDDITVTQKNTNAHTVQTVAEWVDANGRKQTAVSTVSWPENDLPTDWGKAKASVKETLIENVIKLHSDETSTEIAEASFVKKLFSLGGVQVSFGTVRYQNKVQTPGIAAGRVDYDLVTDEAGKRALTRVDKSERENPLVGFAAGKRSLFLSFRKK